MAYVAITDALRQEVRGFINQLNQSELGTMTEPSAKLSEIVANADLRKAVVENLWARFPVELRPIMQEYSRRGTVEASIHLENDLPNQSLSFRDIELPCMLWSADPASYRQNFGTNDHQLLAELAELITNRRECNNRWSKVKSQVNDFLVQCKSLNEAVKLWPDVARYLPKDKMARLNQKAEKQQREASAALAALKNIDMESVNVSTVLARMAGAKV